jgi:proteasome lid subunit RPN8/RPN11
VILTEAELATIHERAEAEYPAECCGVVLVRNDPAPARRVLPCRNIQDAEHARDPERFPRDARTAYYMDPDDIMAFSRLESQGYRLHVIYHSHIDAGAYFSETDRRQALVDGQPTYPDATYVVVAVDHGRAGDARAFRWDAARGDFGEVPLSVG